VNERACGGGISLTPPHVVVPQLAPGSYAVWVDGYRGTVGRGMLDLTLGAPLNPPADDNCPGAPLVFDNNGLATHAVDTTAANNDKAGSCSGADGADEVFTFTIAATQEVTATLRADPMAPGLRPVLHIRRDDGKGCAGSVAEVGCATPVGDTATLLFPRLPAGTYFVWADALGISRGKGTLTVQQQPAWAVPANCGCNKPTPIVAGVPVAADTTPANDAFGARIAPACDPSNLGRYAGHDLAYVYTPVADGIATFLLDPDPTWDAALFVLPALCVADGSTCALASDVPGAGSEEIITTQVTANTAYFVVVDAPSVTQAGPFTLSVN
jgi:hypothetical protein